MAKTWKTCAGGLASAPAAMCAAAAGLLFLQEAARAQTPSAPPAGRAATTERGKVISLEGPEGSVVVVRGAQAYALLAGDILFEGDRVFTRSNGKVTLSAGGCEQTLEAASSIIVDDDICEIAPVMLAEASSVAAAPLAPAPLGAAAAAGAAGGASAAGTVGANPALLTALGAGGTAAALAGNGNGSSASFAP